jgi:hypothetical protein
MALPILNSTTPTNVPIGKNQRATSPTSCTSAPTPANSYLVFFLPTTDLGSDEERDSIVLSFFAEHYYSNKLTLSFNDFYEKRQSPISGRIGCAAARPEG